MTFVASWKLVMKAICEAVRVHQPKVLIQAQRYEAKRPAAGEEGQRRYTQ